MTRESLVPVELDNRPLAKKLALKIDPGVEQPAPLFHPRHRPPASGCFQPKPNRRPSTTCSQEATSLVDSNYQGQLKNKPVSKLVRLLKSGKLNAQTISWYILQF